MHSVQLTGTPHSIPSVIAVEVETGGTDVVVEKKLVVVSVRFCEVVLAIYYTKFRWLKEYKGSFCFSLPYTYLKRIQKLLIFLFDEIIFKNSNLCQIYFRNSIETCWKKVYKVNFKKLF